MVSRRCFRRPGAPAGTGLRLGARCGLCCCGFMDLGAMALLAGAITIERLTSQPERVARSAGVVAIAIGTLMIARAMGMA
jgi:hypothetical protein